MNKEAFNEIVRAFNESDQDIKINHLLVYEKGSTFKHIFTKDEPNDIRSISKTVMTLLFGRLSLLSSLEGQNLSEETYIYPTIKKVVNITNTSNIEKLKKVQVKHLLTHSIGYEDVLLMRDDIKDMDPFKYVEYIVNHPIKHHPGEYYMYSNAGFYLLSVFLQELLGKDLLEVADEVLFSELNIKDYRWERYGAYLAGATRLWFDPEDLLQIGKLLLNNGSYEGKQLLPDDWVTKMTTLFMHTPKVDTPENLFRRYGYGYGIWVLKDSFYFAHGTDGQIMVIVPSEEMIIITLSEEVKMKSIEAIVDNVLVERLK